MLIIPRDMTTNEGHPKVEDSQAHLTLLRTNIAGLKNSIGSLRSHALMACDDTEKMSEAAFRGQPVKVSANDAHEQVEIASRILYEATTVEATIAVRTTVGSCIIYRQHHTSHESEATQASDLRFTTLP